MDFLRVPLKKKRMLKKISEQIISHEDGYACKIFCFAISWWDVASGILLCVPFFYRPKSPKTIGSVLEFKRHIFSTFTACVCLVFQKPLHLLDSYKSVCSCFIFNFKSLIIMSGLFTCTFPSVLIEKSQSYWHEVPVFSFLMSC